MTASVTRLACIFNNPQVARATRPYLFSARGSAAFTPLQCPAGRPRWELQALAPIPKLKRAEARAPGTLNTYPRSCPCGTGVRILPPPPSGVVGNSLKRRDFPVSGALGGLPIEIEGKSAARSGFWDGPRTQAGGVCETMKTNKTKQNHVARIVISDPLAEHGPMIENALRLAVL